MMHVKKKYALVVVIIPTTRLFTFWHYHPYFPLQFFVIVFFYTCGNVRPPASCFGKVPNEKLIFNE